MLRLIALSTLLVVARPTSVNEHQINQPDGVSREYCNYDTFRGRCWRGEVMVITRALWGRMATGRCVEVHPNLMETHGKDPQFLGCYADVQLIADRKCSGKSECDIKIPDPEFDNIRPCYAGLTMYFETSYQCVRVVQESRSCIVNVNSDKQYISSGSSQVSDSKMSRCGSKLNPWLLEAAVGQRINIGLLDFTGSISEPRKVDVTCRHYGYVVEKSTNKNVSICASVSAEDVHTLQRESAVFVSDRNNVVLVVAESSLNYNFLVSVHATGCTNMIPPDNAWLKRSNNDVIIGCYLSQQTWQLKCDEQEWKGQVGTCPDTYNNSAFSNMEQKSPENFTGVGAMITIGSAALIICSSVIGIGCCCLGQYKKETDKTPHKETLHDAHMQPMEYMTYGNGNHTNVTA